MTEPVEAANHHAHHPGFSGFRGFVAALTMITGRMDNARTAATLGGVGEHDAVVDIGCGPGAAARHAARLGATVIGVDPAPVMLRVARTLTHSRRVRYREGSAEAVTVESASAAVAWAIATVHHWHDIDTALDEVRRVLQPGGRFVAIERATQRGAHGIASHGWTAEQAATFARQCSEHGFVDVRTETHTGRRSPTHCVVAIAPS